jgi:hypothetical protein
VSNCGGKEKKIRKKKGSAIHIDVHVVVAGNVVLKGRELVLLDICWWIAAYLEQGRRWPVELLLCTAPSDVLRGGRDISLLAKEILKKIITSCSGQGAQHTRFLLEHGMNFFW